ncbi:MAG: haloacid dehalogenase type II [Acidisphaera sp.]|nr:haloacid dehalogenase type II [Acidisphaera sp.]
MTFRPKYITFDCYGTLTWFRTSDMARSLLADRVPPERMEAFCRDWGQYRFDEVLGAWKPYPEVIDRSMQRVCQRWGIEYRRADSDAVVAAIPSWGPHPDVPAPLARVAREFPLVILSNASDDQIQSNVDKLGAPFHRVFTAQQAQAYKPRYQAFEYMLDQLGASPEEILHVSSSMRYDLISAWGLRFGMMAFVARGHDPAMPSYGAHEIPDIGGLPGLVGL